VLAFTAAQWNANHDVLSPARSSDQTADAAVQKGRSDVQIRQVLKGSGIGGRSGTTTTSTTTS
jgi:hypothetical protein